MYFFQPYLLTCNLSKSLKVVCSYLLDESKNFSVHKRALQINFVELYKKKSLSIIKIKNTYVKSDCSGHKFLNFLINKPISFINDDTLEISNGKVFFIIADLKNKSFEMPPNFINNLKKSIKLKKNTYHT